VTRSLLFITMAGSICLAQQGDGARKQDLQQRFAEIRQSVAQNRERLRHYAWVESTEVRLKGEAKKMQQNNCSYGPDGNIQKTPVGEPSAAKKPRGLKGKIAKNKIEDIQGYMDRVGSLISRYVPPDPDAMQSAFQAGKASIEGSRDSGPLSLVLRDYAKPGDSVTFLFDPANRKLRSFKVGTYLDEPKDVVNLNADFSALADGTNYVQQSVLDATAKSIQIKTTNFGHHKVN
jgi:hypothetical protein